MAEKLCNQSTRLLSKSLSRYVVVALFAGMILVWTIDSCTLRYGLRSRHNHHQLLVSAVVPTSNSTATAATSTTTTTSPASFPPTQPPPPRPLTTNWVSVRLAEDYTNKLMARWLTPGGEPCKDLKTTSIRIPGLDDSKDSTFELTTGDIHEVTIEAYAEDGTRRCLGGDYFEIDVSGERWKSRPPTIDHGNGSYSFSLQVHPDFAGDYNLTVVLLFRSYLGLKFSPERYAYRKEQRHLPIRFRTGSTLLPAISTCSWSDFKPELWTGRWTRHGKNDSCEISDDGRYRCLPPAHPCLAPWCAGPLGSIESNGWVYSAHCGFKIFTGDEAWKCLAGKWLFFWGDSNHVDTIRNMLNFILYHPEIKAVPRRFDANYTNPKDPSQTVRITSIFNGHWNHTLNYQGLDSLRNRGFRELVEKYFQEEKTPDVMILNSGLHDGVHWSSLRAYTQGAEFAAKFWERVLSSAKARPRLIYRTTVATGGYARDMAFNPNKIEAFNRVLLEKLKTRGLLDGVVDQFDMTYPWHFDNRCNDGVHYGRGPAKAPWKDGLIGHQYFVDLMLAHVLFNAICS